MPCDAASRDPGNFYGQSGPRGAPGSPPRQQRIRPQNQTEQHACTRAAGIDVFTHRIKAPVADVEYPAITVDIDTTSADECPVFVFHDEILVIGKPVGDLDLRLAIVGPPATCRRDRAHDIVTACPGMADGHQGETAIITQQLAEPLVVVVSDNGQVSPYQVRDRAIRFGHSASSNPALRLLA